LASSASFIAGSMACPSPPRLPKYSSCSSIELVAISSSRLRPLSWKPGALANEVPASSGYGEPVAKFFGEAEPRVRSLTVPPSLSKVHDEYLEAVVLYRKASDEMLAFTKDGERQHLVDAQGMGVAASEDLLRAGEVLWPGQYKPH